jgi:hypothetical protein
MTTRIHHLILEIGTFFLAFHGAIQLSNEVKALTKGKINYHCYEKKPNKKALIFWPEFDLTPPRKFRHVIFCRRAPDVDSRGVIRLYQSSSSGRPTRQ